MEKTSLKTGTQSILEEKILDWDSVQKSFDQSFGTEIYTSWLKHISLIKEYNDHVVLGVKTRFFRDWITSRYADKILSELKKHKLSINRIEFKIEPENINNKVNFSDTVINKITDIKNSFLNYNRLNPSLNFDNFVVGKSNNLGFLSAKKICSQLSRYNPLFIYGGVGLGKTHLLNSIGLELSQKNKVMFISAERFMYQFIKSIKKNEMVNFKDFFRKANVFIIDDIQFIRGKEGLQEEFFHTFNTLFDQSAQIVISSDRAPNKLDRVQDRIKSRLSGGLVVDIGTPDYDLKINILRKKISDYQLSFKENPDLNEEVINYIAKNSNSNIRELVGIFNRVVAFGKMSKKSLNVNDCKIILRDIYNTNKVISIDKIQNVTSNFFSISMSDMLSQRRSRPLARPRQMAMYLAKKLTTRSLPEIGRKFSNRDHTTVIHAVKTIEKLIENNDDMRKNAEELKSLILSD
ncbi:MAG: chromosomal replication initiator protein DnaA [Candidatus Pelagibacter sp.]|nr:chromosomal replication initiator protein DnaA [Candidatus Pelagibacter sp.]|tara:strand:+ start:6675 stop:8063 length:1389 start_codon:yes stop_codon:yes gene_type:complete